MSKNKVIVRYTSGAVNIKGTARANGILEATLRSRIRTGKTAEEALAKPVRKYIGTSKSYPSEYGSWLRARRRVSCPKEIGWENYGGRGIRMCDRWLNNFEAFLEDMGIKPGPEYTIERKNNDGDYAPENCCWATRKAQSVNKRNNVWIETPWGKLPMAEVSRRTGISAPKILYRVKRHGITHEEAVFNWKKHALR